MSLERKKAICPVGLQCFPAVRSELRIFRSSIKTADAFEDENLSVKSQMGIIFKANTKMNLASVHRSVNNTQMPKHSVCYTQFYIDCFDFLNRRDGGSSIVSGKGVVWFCHKPTRCHQHLEKIFISEKERPPGPIIIVV
jgi:hypothetical protein